MLKQYFIFVFLFVLLFQSSLQQPSTCEEWTEYFHCQSVTSCMDSSGVCECANGNQCVWTNYGNQRVNCPCYDGTPTSLEQPLSYPTDYCLTVFDKQKCGYETTCNPLINTVTCRCPDGSTCIWNDGISLNCPCQGTYSSIDDYRTERDTECQSKITLFNCPADGVIHCQSGVGTCKCTDGTLCAWGATYSVNCPCAS